MNRSAARASTRSLAARLFLLATLAPGLALAAGSGAAIPETGGHGAGAASADTKGLAANPAAASGVGGSEATLDVALMMLWVRYKRAPYDGSDTAADPDRTFRSVESLLAVPEHGPRGEAQRLLHARHDDRIRVPDGRGHLLRPALPPRGKRRLPLLSDQSSNL